MTVAFVDLDDGTVWGADPNGADRRRLLPASVRRVRFGRLVSRRLASSRSAPTRADLPCRAEREEQPRVWSSRRRQPRGGRASGPDAGRLAFAAEAGTVHPYRAVSVVGVDGQRAAGSSRPARTTAQTPPGGPTSVVGADAPVQRVALNGLACPADRISRQKSSTEAQYVVPAAETTFSSIMIEPRSSAPKCSATWPILRPAPPRTTGCGRRCRGRAARPPA